MNRFRQSISPVNTRVIVVYKTGNYIVMPNHPHGILVITEKNGISSVTIPEIIRGYKSFSAREINKIRKQNTVPVWQRNYYEHIIRDDREWAIIRDYIEVNPLRWRDNPEYLAICH